ncbi:MAG: hypothetical protein FJ403_01455 [Verrucomicrobia bacterium]|nr:hypothetical protein [Verrucomicrobiota bacterium]
MITAKQVRDLITADPFRPFRIHLSDGSHYDVTHRDMAIVEKNTIDVGINVDSDGIAGGLVRCAILHIVRLADIEAGVQR